MKLNKIVFLCCVLNALNAFSQRSISSEDFKPYTSYFSLAENHEIEGNAKDLFLNAIGNNQFVGIAEVHDSQQLSFFTTGFLKLLKQKGFHHFALEIGPYSSAILQGISKQPEKIVASIKSINRTYGKKGYAKSPIPFVKNTEDALFVQQASELGFKFWGLDQEYLYSYEMHLDSLYAWANNGSKEFDEYYEKSKEIIKKSNFKRKVNGKPRNCWFTDEPTINKFFELCQHNLKAKGLIDALKVSLEIYCINESSGNSNQQRADYMKTNFDEYYQEVQKNRKSLPKVVLKFGSVHLTHGISPFGVHDVGEYLTKKAKDNNTGFLAIRHLSKYRNGRNLVGKLGWKGNEILMTLGKKDKWTVVDLRPIREKLERKVLKASKKISFEVYSYDLLLIPPNDTSLTLNY